MPELLPEARELRHLHYGILFAMRGAENGCLRVYQLRSVIHGRKRPQTACLILLQRHLKHGAPGLFAPHPHLKHALRFDNDLIVNIER